MNNYWETDFSVKSQIQFFVFSRATFNQPCEEAREYQLKRYQFTKEYLDEINWTVTYP